jgi:hypothetical protein
MLDRHDRASRQIALVPHDDTCANCCLLRVAKIDEPDDPRMVSAKSNGELAEILIKGYQDLGVLCGVGENLIIPRICAPITDPFLFVSRALELWLRTRPDAVIQQELQAASSVMMGSTRS